MDFKNIVQFWRTYFLTTVNSEVRLREYDVFVVGYIRDIKKSQKSNHTWDKFLNLFPTTYTFQPKC